MRLEPVFFGFASLTPARLLLTSALSAIAGFALSVYERSLRSF
jgi:hypothetical protein